jgi:1,4-dihydroxy-6-naphthoate synthase
MRKITIYHSPDSDDAFMFYGMTSGAICDPNIDFQHQLSDIESLNQRALKNELEVTAISVHAYAYLQRNYVILNCGASMGEKNYGPKVITKPGVKLTSQSRIAIPGKLTSAALALKLFISELQIEPQYTVVQFDEIVSQVKAGEYNAGLIIHEAQLNYQEAGLVELVDLGAWWWRKTQLPLPLGINIARRDLGHEIIEASASILKRSIEYSLAHRPEALSYALQFSRGLTKEQADKFVSMYVNRRTLNLKGDGERSISLFLKQAAEKGFVPEVGRLEIF